MARKAASDSAEGHGRNDILGVIFFALAVIVLIALYNLWRAGLWVPRREAVVGISAVIVVTFVLWMLARVLKKTRVLQAD